MMHSIHTQIPYIMYVHTHLVLYAQIGISSYQFLHSISMAPGTGIVDSCIPILCAKRIAFVIKFALVTCTCTCTDCTSAWLTSPLNMTAVSVAYTVADVDSYKSSISLKSIKDGLFHDYF